MAEAAAVGFVAIGRNEGDRLKGCLRSIPPGSPTVYVDSASDDDSVAFARSRGIEVLDLDLTRPFTAARARNEGFDRLLEIAPQIEFVQFLDGDCQLEDGWLESALTFLQAEPEVAIVCGRRRELAPDASIYNQLCDQEWDTPIGPVAACGGDALARTTAVVQVGGFDPLLTAGEEPDLCQRLRLRGWLIWRIDSPMTIHDAAMHRFSQWWMRAVRSGYGYAQAWRKTAGSPEPLYRRELLRAFAWTGGVASIAVLASLAMGIQGLLVGPTIWFVQLTRLARRRGLAEAAHLLVGKFAEAHGACKYLWASIVGRKESAIFYK